MVVVSNPSRELKTMGHNSFMRLHTCKHIIVIHVCMTLHIPRFDTMDLRLRMCETSSHQFHTNMLLLHVGYSYIVRIYISTIPTFMLHLCTFRSDARRLVARTGCKGVTPVSKLLQRTIKGVFYNMHSAIERNVAILIWSEYHPGVKRRSCSRREPSTETG